MNLTINDVTLYQNYLKMGKGDKRSKRGKIVSGTFGKTRPRQNNKTKTADKKE